ncbi:MAG: nuclear transport factor 2 family protein [Nocardiopsaceae bacterium]|nr:nuclear transport factor 2 family protein [Nocardiopsaceae bacterium]
MTMSVADRLAIHELIALHGHLSDAGDFGRMDEVFAADVVYDLADFGGGVVQGRDALRDMALAMGDRNPVGHHVTNVVITVADGETAQVRSKGIGINADGTSGSVVYDDVVRRLPDGWRIVSRKVTARRQPLVP